MSHLSHDELLAAAEGREARPEHLAACPSCRSDVEAIAQVLRDVASVQVPEPSPLFWERFSERVRARCREQAPASLRAVRWWRLVVPVAVGLALIVAAGRLFTTGPRTAAVPVTVASAAPAAATRTTASADPAATPDDSWSTFAAVASEADPAGDAFSAPTPGVADAAVQQMTDEERGELIRLLEDELARGGARGEG